jgi:hypothetical protein
MDKPYIIAYIPRFNIYDNISIKKIVEWIGKNGLSINVNEPEPIAIEAKEFDGVLSEKDPLSRFSDVVIDSIRKRYPNKTYSTKAFPIYLILEEIIKRIDSPIDGRPLIKYFKSSILEDKRIYTFDEIILRDNSYSLTEILHMVKDVYEKIFRVVGLEDLEDIEEVVWIKDVHIEAHMELE